MRCYGAFYLMMAFTYKGNFPHDSTPSVFINCVSFTLNNIHSAFSVWRSGVDAKTLTINSFPFADIVEDVIIVSDIVLNYFYCACLHGYHLFGCSSFGLLNNTL